MWNEFFLVLAVMCAPKLGYLITKGYNKWEDDSTLNLFQKLVFLGVSSFARHWNGYEVHGLEKFTKAELKKNCLLVGYHSRGTVDLIYLFNYLQPSILISHLFFSIPGFSALLTQFGLISSNSHKNDKAEARMVSALRNGNKPVMLMPGGAYECLKLHDQIGSVQWKEEPGFARLIAKQYREEGQVIRVIPFYTKNCETIYFNTAWWYDYMAVHTKRMYDRFKEGNVLLMPILLTCVMVSTGFFLLPTRVKVDTYFGEALLFNEGVLDSDTKNFAAVTGNEKDVINKSKKGDKSEEEDNNFNYNTTANTSSSTSRRRSVSVSMNFSDTSTKKNQHHKVPQETAAEFAARVSAATQKLIATVDALPERKHLPSNTLYLCLLGLYTLLQNTLITAVALVAIWSTYPFLFVYVLVRAIKSF